MTISLFLASGEYDWDGNQPANTQAIQKLQDWAPHSLPEDYLELLRCSDGGQGEFSCYPEYVRIWPAATVIDYNEGYEIQRWLPGFVGIGDNGGPDFVAFDMRSGSPYPISAFMFAPMELEQAIPVARDFEEFLHSLKKKDSI